MLQDSKTMFISKMNIVTNKTVLAIKTSDMSINGVKPDAMTNANVAEKKIDKQDGTLGGIQSQ